MPEWLTDINSTPLVLLYFATLVTALVGFGYWAVAQRRRPEIQFLWQISESGRTADLRPWEPHEIPTITPGQGILIEASVCNVGDQTGSSTLSNLVAPVAVSLARSPERPESPTAARNGIAGVPPDYEAQFLAAERSWYIDMWWVQRFVITAWSPTEGAPDRFRLLMEVTDDRFNGAGRRWLPSIDWSEGPTPTYLERWPGKRSARPRLRLIRALPKGRVACAPGSRRDVRDLKVLQPPPAESG